jgi:hypothetical protein
MYVTDSGRATTLKRDPRIQRLHEVARNEAFAQRAKDAAAVFRGEQSPEQLGFLAAIYRPAQDFRVEVVDDSIFVSPILAPSTAYLTNARGGWPTEKYNWSLEDGGLCIRQKPTARDIVTVVSGGTADIYDSAARTKRSTQHADLWQRWRAAQKGRAA